MKLKLTPETRAALFARNWHVASAYQPPWLFPDDGRKLKRCPIPSDPWHVMVLEGSASYLFGHQIGTGTGATADEAVMSVIRSRGDLRAALGRLAAACDDLARAYHEA
jgi:hypothetical protein